MVSRRTRLASLLFLPAFVGIGAGLTASKILWNYVWSPPTVKVSKAAQPEALALFQKEKEVKILSDADRNDALAVHLRNCQGGGYCTFGRFLAATGNDEWFAAPTLPETEVRSILESMIAESPASFLGAGQRGIGVVATYVGDGERRTIVAFETRELWNDTYGYAEGLFRHSGPDVELLDSIYYFFDIAGIEFATPKVLVAMGVGLAYIVAICGFVVARYGFGGPRR